MSSILKALKKLESEKAQRDELSTAVSSDILRSTRRDSRRSPFPLIVMGAVAVFGVVAGAYYFVGQRPRLQQVVPTESRDRVDVPPAPLSRPVPPPVLVPSSSEPDIPLPRLSGIVYQDNPESRLAIINDLPVMEGTHVEGFVIKAIRPDKVILTRSGVDYDLKIRPE